MRGGSILLFSCSVYGALRRPVAPDLIRPRWPGTTGGQEPPGQLTGCIIGYDLTGCHLLAARINDLCLLFSLYGCFALFDAFLVVAYSTQYLLLIYIYISICLYQGTSLTQSPLDWEVTLIGDLSHHSHWDLKGSLGRPEGPCMDR